ncbi:MAG TPA: hypothetical protein VN493_27415 [Thermoanaerobaculia bacterium]|nr:hypothetical protein [Thermoanaerobaculia bacterium]
METKTDPKMRDDGNTGGGGTSTGGKGTQAYEAEAADHRGVETANNDSNTGGGGSSGGGKGDGSYDIEAAGDDKTIGSSCGDKGSSYSAEGGD